MGRPKGHGYAALAPADVEDAKRGNPGADLRDYAQARGLEFLDRALPAGFSAALPLYLFRIDRRRHHAPFGFKETRKLDDLGLPGWRMRAQEPVSDDLVRRL